MNRPTPAIVAQSAVRRLPRVALLLLCLAYVLPGFIGREPWRTADITSFGYMLALGHSSAGSEALSWLNPQLLGYPTQVDALLPYWLGAWAIRLFAGFPSIPAHLAARVPFVLLLCLVLATTWYAVYGLARTRQAQPVMFAFGGEASPADYARAIADGGLLALIASLGLALLSHETSVSLVQLAFSAVSFCAVVQWLRQDFERTQDVVYAALTLTAGLMGLALSGAPTVAALYGAGSALIVGLSYVGPNAELNQNEGGHRFSHSMDLYIEAIPGAGGAKIIALCTAAAAALAWGMGLWRWRIEGLPSTMEHIKGMARLLMWFGWPAMPLAGWTLWRWRKLWHSPHVTLPLWFLAVAVGTTLSTPGAERSLLLGLPALAALAAFALPTLSRTVTALIDWFTMLFFSGWALVLWVVWIAMQTGFPAKPAANVARLAPGFVSEFSLLAFLAALAATVAWIALVRWRVGRHRKAIWKSLVLPAGGATLGWVLIMTLLLGPLDYALSNTHLVQRITLITRTVPGCAEVRDLSPGLITALRYHGHMQLQGQGSHCPWLVVVDSPYNLVPAVNPLQWMAHGQAHFGPRGGEGVQVYRRLP